MHDLAPVPSEKSSLVSCWRKEVKLEISKLFLFIFQKSNLKHNLRGRSMGLHVGSAKSHSVGWAAPWDRLFPFSVDRHDPAVGSPRWAKRTWTSCAALAAWIPKQPNRSFTSSSPGRIWSSLLTATNSQCLYSACHMPNAVRSPFHWLVNPHRII